MLIPKRFRNICLGVKTYPGADIESDHCPVVRNVRARLKICKKTQQINLWDMRILINNEPRERVRKAMGEV